MTESIIDYLRSHRDEAYLLLRRYVNLNKSFLLRTDLMDEFQSFAAENHAASIAESPLGVTVLAGQEAAVESPWLFLAFRPRIGKWRYLRFHVETVDVEEISACEYLAMKERIVERTNRRGRVAVGSRFDAVQSRVP